MKVLVACEESQRVCTAFRDKGHEAYSCDLQDCSGGYPEWHVKGDVANLLDINIKFNTMDGKNHAVDKWDMIIAHPPCTFLTNSQNWLYNVERFGLEKVTSRKKERDKAFNFFMEFVDFVHKYDIPLAIENPVGYMNSFIKPSQIIQPFEFGHPYSKKTCLWLYKLPNLKSTKIVEPISSWAYNSEDIKGLKWGSDEIRKLRSKTFEGIAKAMAEQWG